MRVTAVAPATTANLGPGFDCLGAAVTIHLRLRADTDAPGRWAYSGPNADDAQPPPDLILAALRAAAGEAVEVGLDVETAVPLGRGLGSSAAAIAAGLVAGCAIAGRDPDAEDLLRLGLPLEGHPDNLAAALHGGLTLVVAGEVIRFHPAPAVHPVFLVPHEKLATKQARGALPGQVSMGDAVASLARTAGLVSMLSGSAEATAERLLACTQDVLHQPYRAPLMPATAELVKRLRDAGVAAFVSGAGPAVGCLLTGDTQDTFLAQSASLDGWQLLEPKWDPRGAHVIDT